MTCEPVGHGAAFSEVSCYTEDYHFGQKIHICSHCKQLLTLRSALKLACKRNFVIFIIGIFIVDIFIVVILILDIFIVDIFIVVDIFIFDILVVDIFIVIKFEGISCWQSFLGKCASGESNLVTIDPRELGFLLSRSQTKR